MNMLQRQFGIMSSLSMGEGREFSNYLITASIPHGGVVYNWNAIGDLKDYTGGNGQWASIQNIRDEILNYNTVVFAYYEQEKDSIVRLQVDATGVVFFISPDGGHISVTESGLKGALSDIIFPVGSILAFAGITTPEGWLWCNGDAISRVTYSTLFTICGTAYGQGDGFSTFNLPDFRGKFMEGGTAMDQRSYIDAGLPTMVHNHTGITGDAGAHTHSVSVSSAGGHTHTRGTMEINGYFMTNHSLGLFMNGGFGGAFSKYGSWNESRGGNGGSAWTGAVFKASDGWTGATSNSGAHTHSGSSTSAGGHTHSITVGNSSDSGIYGKSETVQPAACTCNYIIKF